MDTLLHAPAPSTVLVVAAHPDDIEFMAGGTLARWITAGTRVHYLLATDGGGGSRDPGWQPATLAAARRAEQCTAAAVLGVASITFLGLADATLEANGALRLAIARVIRQIRPDVVLTFDPHTHYTPTSINHPDHVAIGAATLGAIMPLANTLLAAPTLAAEGLEPHDVEQVYLFETALPTHWMPLNDHELTHKLAALRAHASQLAAWDGEACARARAEQTAANARDYGIHCRFAEAFASIRLACAPVPVAVAAPARVQDAVAAFEQR